MPKFIFTTYEVVNNDDLYQFIISDKFRRYLKNNHYHVYEFIDSYNNHPEIKNDWLMEGLIVEGYLPSILTLYLRDKLEMEGICYYPPKDKINVENEKIKFIDRNICMVTVSIDLATKQMNILKLKNPTEYERIRKKFLLPDIGW